ncbi:hypothetical protein FHX82_001427 [Amycolatopsis bartoniae]|nr:hypothetical protein [Amycolatopsis bartoniae]
MCDLHSFSSENVPEYAKVKLLPFARRDNGHLFLREKEAT